MKYSLLVFVFSAVNVGIGCAAVTYTDATGENFDSNAHMDIVSVTIGNTSSTITFTINLNGLISSPTDWGKYTVGISTSPTTGDTGIPDGSAWDRNIRMAEGMDAWIGSWVDGSGGAQAWTFNGSSWSQNALITPTIGLQHVSFTFNLSDLGLSLGNTFNFDVYTTGGLIGDSANDALANPNQTIGNWQDPYSTPSTGTGASLSYTLIPEPSAAFLGGLGLLGLLLRRRD